MSGGNGSGQHGSTVQWVAVVVSVIALLAGAYNAVRAYKAQEQSNHIAQKNAELQKQLQAQSDKFQEQLQAQSHAAEIRSSAQQVVLTTSPAEYSPGQTVQGVTVNNGTHKKITRIYIVFTTGSKYTIVDRAYYDSLAPCTYMTLSFASSFPGLPLVDWDAWIYFTDADGNIWLSDLFGHFSQQTNVPPEGQDVTGELNLSSSVLGFCGQ
jgi:hypothetical protein